MKMTAPAFEKLLRIGKALRHRGETLYFPTVSRRGAYDEATTQNGRGQP